MLEWRLRIMVVCRIKKNKVNDIESGEFVVKCVTDKIGKFLGPDDLKAYMRHTVNCSDTSATACAIIREFDNKLFCLEFRKNYNDKHFWIDVDLKN